MWFHSIVQIISMKISSRKNKSEVWHLEPSSSSLAHFNEENNANRVTTIQLMHHTLYLLRFLSQITFCRIGPLSIFCRCCFLGCVVGPTFGRWWLPRISSVLGGVWGRRLLPMQWFPFITFWVQLVNFWEGFRSFYEHILFKWDLLLSSFVNFPLCYHLCPYIEYLT